MKTKQKLGILCLVFLMIMFSSCATVHETTSTRPKMTISEAMASLKEAIKDTKQDPFADNVKVVTNIFVTEDGISLISSDNTKRYYLFSDMIDPAVGLNHINQIYFVKLKQELNNFVAFKNKQSAIMFADALYYLKHVDIKREREKEKEDCLRLSRQTPIDLILAGTTADGLNLPCSAVPQAQIESILNENLVEWESKGLGERLQKSSPEQLRDLVVKLTKGILKLDLKVKELKDAADEDARQVQVPGQTPPVKKAPGALTMARLLEQRKTILSVIQNKVRQVAALRASGG